MDISKKIEIAATAVASIATHSDVDSVVLAAALNVVAELIVEAKKAVADKAAAEAVAAIAKPSA